MRSSLVFICVLVPLSADALPDARSLGLDRLDSRGHVTTLVGNPQEFTDPLQGWGKTHSLSVTIYADPQFKKPIGNGQCIRTGSPDQETITATFSVDAPGTYYVLRKIEGIGKWDGLNHRYGAFWSVTAYWPTLKVSLYNTYFFGEYGYFSFAAGHSDYNAYSYSVTIGSDKVDSLGGAVVSIDGIWKKARLQRDNTVTVNGYYRGHMFSYQDPESKLIRTSTWRFKILKPPLSSISFWERDSTFDAAIARNDRDALNRLDLNLRTDYNPLQFRYSYATPTPSGFATTLPDFQNLTVKATPEQFLASWQVVEAYPWRLILIAPNEEFMSRTSFNSPAQVSLTIRFRTQFGEEIDRTYKALVFSSKY